MAGKAWFLWLPVVAALLGAAGFETQNGQWRAMPAFHVQANGLYPGAVDFSFQRTDYGLRGTFTSKQVSILTIGGATTEQPYLPDALTWQSLLQELLAQDGRKVGVGNGGRLAGNLADHLRQIDQWAKLPDFRPKFVLIMLEDPSLTAHPPERRSPKSRSALYARWFGTYADFPVPIPAATPATPPTAETNSHIHQLAQNILLWGAVPVFVTVPGTDSVNGAALKQCRRDDLLCLDAAHDIAWHPADLLPGGGLTPTGAAKMARWLFSKLAILV